MIISLYTGYAIYSTAPTSDSGMLEDRSILRWISSETPVIEENGGLLVDFSFVQEQGLSHPHAAVLQKHAEVLRDILGFPTKHINRSDRFGSLRFRGLA
jgi:hypothetical protein